MTTFMIDVLTMIDSDFFLKAQFLKGPIVFLGISFLIFLAFQN